MVLCLPVGLNIKSFNAQYNNFGSNQLVLSNQSGLKLEGALYLHFEGNGISVSLVPLLAERWVSHKVHTLYTWYSLFFFMTSNLTACAPPGGGFCISW